MTAKEAEDKGYQVVRASPYEVGLLHRGSGLRTWWAKDFGGKLPKLDHWLIQDAIAANERGLL